MTATKTTRRGHAERVAHTTRASTGTSSSQGHCYSVDQGSPALAGLDTDPDQMRPATHTSSVRVGSHIPSAKQRTAPKNSPPEGSEFPAAAANHCPSPTHTAPLLLEPYLSIYAALVDDIEALRESVASRLGAATRIGPDKDGEERGLGLTADHPVVKVLTTQLRALETQEKEAVKALEREMRRHPLGAWSKSIKGVGDKQAGRLLAVLNDPYWNDLHGRPRTVSELWAYCGHKPGQRRQKGQRSNWSPGAKMRAHLIAAQAIRFTGSTPSNPRSPYRDVYEKRRARTAITHPEWSDGHSHNDGLRIVAKEFLKDLWIESRRLHADAP